MKTRISSMVIIMFMASTVSACYPVQSPSDPALTPTLAQMSTTTPPSNPTSTSASTPLPKPTVPSAREFHVNPIDGLSPDFIMGADVSMLNQVEISGGKYYDQGIEKDGLEILRDHGVNWIRLRLWNDPTDENGKPLGGGNNDLQRTVEMAVRAKSLGLKFLLDFHYSDWWADPGKQNMPKAWVGLDSDELKQAVYDYTAEAIRTLADAGAMPDMVQIGNEVNGGMLWPAGKTWSQENEVVGGYAGFAELLSQGIQAVRDNDPNNDNPQKKIRVAIHLANGGDNELYRTVFDELTKRKVDFDIIGLSYYSFWHGPFDQFVSNMNDISERYQKDVLVLEAAYPYTLADADGHPNLVGGEEQDLSRYKPTVQGQATAIRDIMAAVAQVPNGRGLGIFYWEPEWIAVEGAGWAEGQGNAWENLAMFDFDGNALPSLNVFNLARPEYGGESIAPTMVEVNPIEVYVPLSEAPELPATAHVVYSDDAIRSVPVIWDAYPPTRLDEVGSFILNGTIENTNLHAVATLHTGSAKNYAENPGFENNLTPWVIEGSLSAVDISDELQNVHNGKYALHYWIEGPFEFTVSQTITGLENGTYTFSAWMQGGGGDTLQLSVSNHGGDPLTVDFAAAGWREWQNPTIKNIVVTNGQCTISLRVTSNGGTWGFFDDAGLFLGEAP
jgi:arabinogalactan endo-1,4-beta-galactosidase